MRGWWRLRHRWWGYCVRRLFSLVLMGVSELPSVRDSLSFFNTAYQFGVEAGRTAYLTSLNTVPSSFGVLVIGTGRDFGTTPGSFLNLTCGRSHRALHDRKGRC